MSETSSEIEAHIHDTRQNLSENLGELEQKVRLAVDWRRQFKAHPLAFAAAALGAGLLLASRNGRRKRPSSR